MTPARTSRAWARRAAAPLLALLLHAVAGALLWMVPQGRAAVGAVVGAPAERTLDLDVGSLDEPAPEATAAASPDAPAEEADTPPPATARSSPGAIAVVSPEATKEPGPGPAPAESAPSAGKEATGAAESGPIRLTIQGPDIGIGGRNRFLPKSQAAVEQAEAKRAVDHALRDPARERERELGLGPEGPVLTALAEGTARSLAPIKGRAVFVATSNADGEVVSLDVASDEGGRGGWLDAARIALAALRGKKLRIPPKTTRAVMRIEVTSAWKLPSGQDPGTDITLFHIPIAKGEGKDSAKVAILDPIPKFHVEYLEIGGPGGAKIPLVSIEINLFNANIDPSNVGARARRIVHTHVIDSQLM